MVSQFDAAAAGYEASATGMPVREYVEHFSIRRLVGDVAGAQVLDLGCGTGLYTRRLVRWGAKRVAGVDASAGMLARARAMETAAPLGITYVHGDLAAGPVASEELGMVDGADLALAVYVLCYAPTTEVLTTMCRTARAYLRPGGRFLAPTFNPDYVDAREDQDYYRPYQFSLTAAAPEPVKDGTVVRLDAWFAQAGVEPVSIEAVWWSRDTYEQALREAGFTHLDWHPMTVGQAGIDAHGADFWQRYLQRPHAVVVEAR